MMSLKQAPATEEENKRGQKYIDLETHFASLLVVNILFNLYLSDVSLG